MGDALKAPNLITLISDSEDAEAEDDDEDATNGDTEVAAIMM